MEPEVKAPETKVEAPINLDALNAPEGTASDNFELFKSKEEKITQPVHSFNGLPNLDPVKDKEEKVEDASVITPEGKIAPPIVDPNKKPDTQNDTPWFHKPFKALQKRLGLTDEEFKMPEGVTEENYDEKYNELLWENTEREGGDNELHPDVQQINKLIKNGVDPKEAITTFQKMNDLISLSDKDILTLSLKQQFGKTEERKDGWDDTKIQERVNKMDASGILEIEAEKIRTQIKNEKETIASRYESQRKEVSAKQGAEIQKARTEQINQSIEILKGMKDVFGIPVSKAELQEFQNDFTVLVTPDKEGRLPISEMLQSNETLVKIAYLLSKGDQKVKTYLTKVKEDAKKSVTDKLDDEPKLPKKTSSYLNEGAIDLDKLEAPAR